MAKVKLGLGDMRVLEKVQFGDTVHTALTGNPNFVTPLPPLTAVQTVTDDLRAAAEAVRLAKLALSVDSRFNAEFSIRQLTGPRPNAEPATNRLEGTASAVVQPPKCVNFFEPRRAWDAFFGDGVS